MQSNIATCVFFQGRLKEVRGGEIREGTKILLSWCPFHFLILSFSLPPSPLPPPLLQAVNYMESLLYSRPPLSLQPGVFGNLSAAYDLESGASQAKKQAYLPLLGQMVGEGFHLPSLNIR